MEREDSVINVEKSGLREGDGDRERENSIRPSGLHRRRRRKEREREIHYVHWASKAYEDESVFMSEADLGWQ